MEVKLFEVRDAATFLPCIAIKLGAQNEQERYLLSRTGYGKYPEDQSKYILFTSLDGSGILTYDVYEQPNRTRRVAHEYIQENFDGLKSGQVIDVEYIIGVTNQPKLSELIL